MGLGKVASSETNENEETVLDEEKQRMHALQAAGALVLEDERGHGLRISGWRIQTKKRSILKMDAVEQWEKMLGTIHLPEMVFGDSSLELVHEASGIKIHFNAFDALCGWKQEALPPVEVPAAAKWKFRSKPSQQVILDYDYTFTTPYCGSKTIELDSHHSHQKSSQVPCVTDETSLEWVECEDRIDLKALQARDPILFYDEVVLYEDELHDNGVSLLTVKVRVMPSCWFLLLRYWLRVDGVLMRLRDTRMFSTFQSCDSKIPLVIREYCAREDTFRSLATRGFSADSSGYNDASSVCDKLQIRQLRNEKLIVKGL